MTVPVGVLGPPLALAGGSLIFLIVIVVLIFAIAFGYYTVRGSGISQTPYRRAGEPPESPSELAHDITQEVGNWERGTAGHHGRHRPAAVREPVDPAVAQALDEWRSAPASQPRLDPPVGPEDHVLGPAGATTVAMYLDLDSEPCRGAVRLLNQLAGTRPLRVAVRQLPLADVHALALPAAEALEAAASQGSFFELLDRLAGASVADEEMLLQLASACVGDPARLREEVGSGRHRATVIKQIREATSSGAHLLPELYIDGVHYDGELRVDPLTRALAARASS
jgi:protein-disulfide isomerase